MKTMIDDARRAGAVVLAAGVLAGCSAPAPEASEASATADVGSDPEAAFREVEDRLLAARTVRLDFEITAEGAVVVALEGRLEMDAGDDVLLTAAGTFAGQPVDVRLETDGETYAFGNPPEGAGAPVPPELSRAILVGMTRMGLLHNLARLTADAPPDHAEGGVASWVVVDEFATESEEPPTVGFAITVAGQPSGSATLALDADGRPLVRRQTVGFPQGEMRVVERYSNVVIEE